MSFWLTNSGKAFTKNLMKEYTTPNRRILLVLGPYSSKTLCLRLGEPLNSICHYYPDLDALTPTKQEPGNCLVLLQSLFSVRNDPMSKLESYCQANKLTLMFAPFEMSPLDYAQEFYIIQHNTPPWENAGAGREWVAQIADESARILCGGSYSSYFNLRRLFMDVYLKNPSTLPDIAECVTQYIDQYCSKNGGHEYPSVAMASRLLQKKLIDQRLIQNRWLILWSLGLAARVDSSWQYSFQLLNTINLRSQLQNRIQLARLRTLPPIYQAWVEYCTRYYELPAWSDKDKLITYYPVDIKKRLDAPNIHDENRTLSVRVLHMRNWLNHGDNSEYVYQNPSSAMKTCMDVITRFKSTGTERFT